MNLQSKLEDELVIIEPLDENDYEALYEVAKDPLIWEQHPCSDRYKKEVFTKFFSESIDSKGAFKIIEKSTGELIGSSRFKVIGDSENAIEIGWTFLSRDKWGGKYNKAVKKLMIDFALQHVDHVIFYVGIENVRSQKALKKLGGIVIDNTNYPRFAKDIESDLTFRIGKENWDIKVASH